MNKNLEIIERSSGFFVTDGCSVCNGPYDTLEEAQESLKPTGNTIEIESSDGDSYRWVVSDEQVDKILEAIQAIAGDPDTTKLDIL